MGSSLGSSIICGNIRGISPGIRGNKLDYLKNLSETKDPFLIMMTESHLSENILDCEVAINGWSTFRTDRVNRTGGGVISYVTDKLTVSNELSVSDSITDLLCL